MMSLWRHTYPMMSHRAMFWHGWTKETPPSSAFTSTSSIDSSRWWTLLLGWCFLRRGTTISPHSSDNCTARRRRSELSSSLPSLFTKCRQRTAPSYLFEELCQPADFEARRRLRSVSSSSLVVRRTWTYHRRSCFSGRCRTHLERSAAARHVCTLAACFSQSS